MSAKFKADSTFQIKGRGLVLAGWVLEGTIKIGMIAQIPSFPRKLTVQGIEMITTHPRRGIIGLLFPFGNEDDTPQWKKLDLKGQVIDVTMG
jgi:hypothetical protein